MFIPQLSHRNSPPLAKYGELRLRGGTPEPNCCLAVATTFRACAILAASSSVRGAAWAFRTMIQSSGGRSRPVFVRTIQTPYPQNCNRTLGCNSAYHVEVPQYCLRRPGMPVLLQKSRTSSSDEKRPPGPPSGRGDAAGGAED